ncbi:Major Facilitator Superfamily protein [Actinopolymorpha cephalotaxi]|uniref:MFS family permease n=1 Tax=Actinopolymorpha cephalotaxi TaxID=504797 RepID=A0A1I2LGK9_9ACTN|nr:MFS transporter [Actinopolymorpha cephalotaxi]NYH84990.1 MFS family permease [Actinopolymorpha cephalotaxi]SFF76216.1 Major Facilitator Superfamily protein [Actinopolymorpha cephalotaxi]
MTDLAGNTRVQSRGEETGSAAAVVVLCGVQFVDVLGVTVVVTALPRMLADLGGTAAAGTLVVTAYAMFFGGLLMVASRVGDRLGHRRVVLGALALFAVASVLGALAESVWMLASARALQGAAAAASVPCALRLLTTVVPEGPVRRRAVAGWSAAGATAGASGFFVGGVLTEIVSWRAVFWLDIVLAAVLAAAIMGTIPRDHADASGVRVGWRSSLLLIGGAMGVVAGTTMLGEDTWRVLGTVVTALGLLATGGFVMLERRSRHPLVERAAWRTRGLRWGAFGSFFATATTSSSVIVATLYLQDKLGLTPLRAAMLLVSFSILAVVGSALAPRLVAMLGWSRSMGAGLGIIAAGTLVYAVWPQVAGIGLAAAAGGLGIGITSVAANDMGTTVDVHLKGTAAGVLNTAAQLGAAVGVAAIGLVATATQPRVAWLVVVAFAAGAAVAAAASRVGDRERDPARRVPLRPRP